MVAPTRNSNKSQSKTTRRFRSLQRLSNGLRLAIIIFFAIAYIWTTIWRPQRQLLVSLLEHVSHGESHHEGGSQLWEMNKVGRAFPASLNHSQDDQRGKIIMTSKFATEYTILSVNPNEKDKPVNRPVVVDNVKIFSDQLNLTSIRVYSRQYDDYSNKSSLDYYACCGAGHRLARTSNAYHMAREMQFGFRVFWGWCGKTELYSHLFGPEPLEDLEDVTNYGQVLPCRNEVPGYFLLQRSKLNEQSTNHSTTKKRLCPCSMKKMKNDVRFFSGLRHRFRLRGTVDDFVRQHFHPARYTIGMHLRAGNNETGLFARQVRQIDNVTSWTDQVARHITTLLLREDGKNRAPGVNKSVPVLFIATDTPSMISRFQSYFSNDALRVVAFPHRLMNEGQGVLFGKQGSASPEGDDCLRGWETTFVDMMVLSHVDTLLVPRLSSFSQTLPMTLAFAQRQVKMTSWKEAAQENDENNSNGTHPPPPTAYCELDRSANLLQCYNTMKEWCCQGKTDQRDLIQVPYLTGLQVKSHAKLLSRTDDENDCEPFPGVVPRKCLPFRWNSYNWSSTLSSL